MDNTFINIVITGIANLVFTFVALFTVEKLGRRTLMLMGAGGLAGIYLVLGACYFFKASGIFMATFFLWVGSFTLTLSFPLLNGAMGTSGTFWIYSAICFVALAYFVKKLPETKGKTLEQLGTELIK